MIRICGRPNHKDGNQRMSKPTLKTLSVATGLAQTTVSRALKNDPKIAAATRARVARAASEIGYVPDRAAQRLRTGRTNVIAFVSSPHTEIIGFRGSMLAGVSDALKGTPYHVSMTPYDTDSDPMRPIQSIVRNRLADGLIFSGTQPCDSRVNFLLDAGFPFVSHGRTLRSREHAWCDFDNGRFVELALDRLALRGCREIVLFRPAPDLTYSGHMTEAAVSSARRLGVRVYIPESVTLSSSARNICDFVRDQIAGGSAPDAYLCPGEVPALAAMAAIEDSGQTVRRDIAVFAKQTSPVFDFIRPRIDRLHEDLYAAGASLGGLLLRRIDGDKAAGLQVLHQPRPAFVQSDDLLGG